MFSRGNQDRYGLLVDVGSGSVGLAIVHSTSKTKQPTVVWSHREHTPLKDIESIEQSSRAIVTTLMNVMMMFDGAGRTALSEYHKHAKITVMQATIAAPWAYTTTRTIKFEQDEPFEITTELLDDLATAAGQQAIDEFSQKHSLESLGISETSRCVLDTYANGYRLAAPNGQKASTVTVTHATSLVRSEIIAAVQEMNQKMFGAVPLQTTSYMLANYFASRVLVPHVYDVCLVDITDEATEIGIIRDGSLKYSTHTPFGRTSIAREIALANNTPIQETFSSLKSFNQKSIPSEVLTILANYTQRLSDLFKETGDRLTIPKTIFLQSDMGTHNFFASLVSQAGKDASKGTVQIINIADKVKPDTNNNKAADTALIFASRFFHTTPARGHFEYL